jgi:hypothetical protein
LGFQTTQVRNQGIAFQPLQAKPASAMICVMAMNSQGNQAPHIPINSSRSESISEQRIISNIDVTINATDVLCGRGKTVRLFFSQ